MDWINPEYLLTRFSTAAFWPQHSLAAPILGTPETVKGFNRDSLRARFRDWFAPDHLVVTPPQRHSRAGPGMVQQEFAT